MRSFPVEILIKLKDKNFKFDTPTEKISEMAWDFQIKDGKLHITPFSYLHLYNIVQIFKRPLAESGDAAKLK